MTHPRIRWTRSSEGHCQSHDGRWRIAPLYMGTTRPQAFALMDCGKDGKGYMDCGWSDSQKLAKLDAEDRLEREERKP